MSDNLIRNHSFIGGSPRFNSERNLFKGIDYREREILEHNTKGFFCF